MKEFGFVFWLHVVIAILSRTNSLSLSLQKKGDIMFEAVENVKACIEDTEKLKKNDKEFHKIWNASEECAKHGFDVPDGTKRCQKEKGHRHLL